MAFTCIVSKTKVVFLIVKLKIFFHNKQHINIVYFSEYKSNCYEYTCTVKPFYNIYMYKLNTEITEIYFGHLTIKSPTPVFTQEVVVSYRAGLCKHIKAVYPLPWHVELHEGVFVSLCYLLSLLPLRQHVVITLSTW